MSTEVRGKKKRLYIRFRWRSRQYQKPSAYYCSGSTDKCKCRGCRSAEALDMEIKRKIDLGTFEISDYFPESKSATSEQLEHIPDITFEEYAKQWLATKKSIVSWSTYRGYESDVKALIGLFNAPVKDITPKHIRLAIANLAGRVKPKTVKNRLLILHNILQTAVDDKIIPVTPYQNIRLPKVIKQPVDPFDVGQVGLILDAFDRDHPEWACFFAIGFYSGLRTGEIMALEWGDIDFTKNEISVSKTMSNGKLKQGQKTGKSIVVDIIPQLMPYIRKHRQYTYLGDNLFIDKSGAAVTDYRTYARLWATVLKKLGLRYRQPYHMRHTFACMMLGAGEDLRWIARQLGHASLQMLFTTYGNWYKPHAEAGAKFAESIKSDQTVTKSKIRNITH